MFSMTCSGACTTTKPRSSKPLRPARPAIWWNSRALRCAVFWPSNLHSRVNSTVRIGHVDAGAERVGPADHLQQPGCASCSTSTRYFGSSPAWCRPMPCRSHLRMSAPYGLLKSKPAIRVGDLGLLLPGADLQAGEVLRAARRVRLREVDDVGGRLALVHELLDRVRQRDLGVGVLERHGPIAGLHRDRRAPVEARERVLEERACRRASPTSAGSAPAAS